MTTYTIRFEGGDERTVEADDQDEAEQYALEFLCEGDYGAHHSTQWVDARILLGDETVGVVTRAIDPDAPPCSPGQTHDWKSPHALVGGLKENPGVWGNGGGIIRHEACAHCGCRRVTDTWASRPDTGEQGLTSVSYEYYVG